jgi:membrane-associated phospholipid phosphatase
MTHTNAFSSSARVLVASLTLAASTAAPAVAQNVLDPAQSVINQQVEDRPPLFEDAKRTAPDTSIGALFRDTIRDFQRLPSQENALFLSFGGLAAGLGREFDHGVSAGMFKSSALDGMLSVGERAGGAKMQLATALTTYAVGRISGHSRTAQIGADLIRANVMTQAMTASIKLSVGRTRPDGTEFSFPSGHSSVSFATATVLQRNLGWKVGAPAYAFATYVAASRVQDKRHFLSDVTFGAALGIVAGRTVTIGRGDAKFALSPAAAPGGAGVQFSWMGKD